MTLAMVFACGCKKQSEPAAPAEVRITEENLDTELDKLAEEIEADIAAEGE
jgi:hypothetical protein